MLLLVDPSAVGDGDGASRADFGDVWRLLNLADGGRGADHLHRRRIRALDRLERIFAESRPPGAPPVGEVGLVEFVASERFSKVRSSSLPHTR